MTRTLSRRHLLGSAAAASLAPAMLRSDAGRYSEALQYAQGLDQLHSLVIRRAGQVELAETFRGPALDRPANIKSVSKTILAILTGIAIDRGVLTGPDQQVLPLLGYDGFGDARDGLTIGHLLSMRGGLESTSGANYGQWVASPDWVAHALSGNLVSPPGGRFIYSTGSWHVLGAALSEASGMSLLEMTRRWLGDPMDIAVPAWVRDPQGNYLGGNDMALRPTDLARIGDMILAGGRSGDVRIVSTDWIETSFTPRGRSPWSGDAYGYGWFLSRFRRRQAAYGRGYGGQMLVVLPDPELSIAITSDPTRPARSGGYFSDLRRLVDEIVVA
ncbi:MAG: beta-lactamase family protein [Rhodobacteraceae bacterium]|nr:beta-lactamase family protein [Paracoccaceae bacterium]